MGLGMFCDPEAMPQLNVSRSACPCMVLNFEQTNYHVSYHIHCHVKVARSVVIRDRFLVTKNYMYNTSFYLIYFIWYIIIDIRKRSLSLSEQWSNCQHPVVTNFFCPRTSPICQELSAVVL